MAEEIDFTLPSFQARFHTHRAFYSILKGRLGQGTGAEE
jgi:hypothetical protein